MNRFSPRTFPKAKEMEMARERDNEPIEDVPAGEADIEREAEANREDIEQVPPPGTDPLHEGP